MKFFRNLLILTLSTTLGYSAMAEDKTTLVLVLGGMGTDGASLEPVPTENSVRDAEAIYKALNVKADRDGKKKVGLTYDGDVVGIECDKPEQGIHTKTAGCEYFTIVKEIPPKKGIAIYVGNITLAPASSQMIFDALDDSSSIRRVGATTKEAGNLKCVRGVRPGVKATCELKNVTVSKMALDQIPVEEQAKIKKLAKKLGL